ncbi:uncharacterized protein TRUGW13939_09704 [Talaromyces rugulosus]|uniref:F-box domain-containing protein n=1 Tax=Talaromyces rugulosus TaxID=121627 RepID=A0A7H8RDB4_TALRU|nr:uncharacterized protein TRUGW13939_09704 [Talaromyces rugulosus]QKX62543.1 hypothetical protein TRUGW13939_09704 [Talaromyces rugulosus]
MMAESTELLDLPTEIHQLIAQYLDFPSLMQLRMICQYFHELIPRLSVNQMLEVEVSAFGIRKDLYTCRDCLRLRPRAKFADNMVRKKKARSAIDAGKRFCVDCGINPREGTTRYTRGSLIIIQGEQYVICQSCGAFGDAAVDGDSGMPECKRCRLFSRAIEQRTEENRARQERARLRDEQRMRRARRRELWGSDYEYSEDDIPQSPTWSEIQMGMIQSEADTYMNSPKPGSD